MISEHFLRGQHLLITHTRGDNSALAKTLREKGGIVTAFPTIQIVAPHDIHELKKNFYFLDHCDKAIFTSTHAVEGLAQYCPIAEFPDIPIYVIGPATANALQSFHLIVTEMADPYSSEGLLNLPSLQNVSEQNVMIFCGENPKPQLADTLKKRGCKVIQAFCYRRILPFFDAASIRTVTEKNFLCIICQSMESLQHLLQIFRDVDRDWLLHQQLLVISKEMAIYAKKRGFLYDSIIADDAAVAAIIDALSQWPKLLK